MNWINAGEVYYVLTRLAGEDRAMAVVRDMRRRLTLEVPTAERVLEAAGIKAVNRLAYAEAFAVATAIAHRATLVTGDSELLKQGTGWTEEDLR